MADLGTIVSKVTTITTGWFQDVNNAVYRWGTTANTIDTAQHAAPSKTTPVDADELKVADSALGFSFARLTFANLRAQLFTLFGAQLNAAASKTTPTGADSFAIQDSAAVNATKQLTITNLLTYLTSALTPTNATNAVNVTTTINSGVVATTQAITDNSTKVATTAFVKGLFTPIINFLGADVLLNNTANYFDGPSIAQGTSGTWYVTGTITATDSVTAAIYAKLWDGTTVIDSGRSDVNANGYVTITLSGYIASPVGNLRISVRDPTAATGKIIFNITGNSKDSTISAIRIG